MLSTMLQEDVCEHLLMDISKHLCIYLTSATIQFIQYAEFGVLGAYTEDLTKPHNCQNWGAGVCKEIGTCSNKTIHIIISFFSAK